MEQTLHDRISSIIEPSLLAMGYGVVQIRMREGSGHRTLQIMAERSDGRAMTVDDCADISRNVSALLDVEDPIPGAYTLEVSSPGIDRPLIKRADFERFKGYDAKVETKLPLEGRRRFKGKLAGVEGDDIRIQPKDAPEARIPLSNLQSAKLVLTDELIKRHQQNS